MSILLEFNKFEDFKNAATDGNVMPTSGGGIKLHILTRDPNYVKIVYAVTFGVTIRICKYVAAPTEIPITDNWIDETTSGYYGISKEIAELKIDS